MNLPLLAAQYFNRAQFVLPVYAEGVVSALAPRLGVHPMTAQAADIAPRPAREIMVTEGGVLVLPVVGGLMHRGDSFDAFCGAQSYTNLNNQILAALERKDVKGILLDMDTPGGMAMGCFELADTILEARKRKPIWAIANGMAASAGYAIASSAERFYVSPSGEVGSIGVCFMHRDVSGALEKAGIVVTYIFAGDHKIDGNPFQPLPADVQAAIQEEANASYQGFIEVVAARRPMNEKQIRDTKARMFRANDAVELKLADEVAPFSKVLAAFTDELNPVYHVSTNGVVTRMSNDTPTPVASGARIEGLEPALDRARKDGEAAATAAAEQKIIAAYSQGRNEAVAIIGSEAASGKLATALSLAKNPKLSVEEAVEMLGTVASGGSGFQEKLKANDPKVPANAPNSGGEAVVSDFQSRVGDHVKSMLSGKR
ncbi:S49 family peptidase [uncultured Hyphomicrobium sp.]|uniref:S49 family peptidase n=1 Tax=uncultured Hyphomicrobium sp. TaxID=194373 RepID=UPI0025F11DDE|nr:S49 family peptidase [uncultured Hyphomicrobium sp.]